ncbi:MAG: hypothetical protein AAF959_07625 [Cyanobacteria bacterium P01_D01_bin.56]
MTGISSDWEHLQSAMMTYYNRQVKEAFRNDIADDDYTTPEGVLRNACLIKDNDTAPMCALKMLNFLFIRQRDDLLDVSVGNVEPFDEPVEYRPQVTLFFEEKESEYQQRVGSFSRNEHPRKKRMRLSFRFANETSETFSQSQLNVLKNEIPTRFPKSYSFRTGRFKHSYRDTQRGYRLILAGYSEAESRELITKVLTLQNHIPDWDFFTESTSSRNFSTKKTVRVLSKTYKLPAKRQVARVYLRKAELYLYGIQKPIELFSRYI